jgi:hypothetical protein
MSTGKENVMAGTNRATAVSPCEKKEYICAPALVFVFAWHRIGAIGAYEK